MAFKTFNFDLVLSHTSRPPLISCLSYVNSMRNNERPSPGRPPYGVHWEENQKMFTAGCPEKASEKDARSLGSAKLDPCHDCFIILLGDLR